jgi:hypothetical protein
MTDFRPARPLFSDPPGRHAASADAVPERRRLEDRRARPTAFRSVLRPGGRRRGFRRHDEGINRYADHVSGRVIALVLAVLIASILDALFTLLHMQHGGQEINPIMRQALAGGPELFLGIKIFGTALGVVFLAIHQHFRLSRMALRCAAAVYGVVLAYHAVLFLG